MQLQIDGLRLPVSGEQVEAGEGAQGLEVGSPRQDDDLDQSQQGMDAGMGEH